MGARLRVSPPVAPARAAASAAALHGTATGPGAASAAWPATGLTASAPAAAAAPTARNSFACIHPPRWGAGAIWAPADDNLPHIISPQLTGRGFHRAAFYPVCAGAEIRRIFPHTGHRNGSAGQKLGLRVRV